MQLPVVSELVVSVVESSRIQSNHAVVQLCSCAVLQFGSPDVYIVTLCATIS